MKHLKYITSILIMFATLSCSIDDIKPNNLLLENTVIVDESSAVNVLNRIYNSALRNRFYGKRSKPGGEGAVELLTVSDQYINFLGVASSNFVSYNENSVLADDTTILSMYTELYYSINLANYFIEIIERGDANVDSARQNELIAEARFFRALSHFNLLRLFGQFYDINSSLGVVVSLAPIKSNTEAKRNSVKETYEAIIEDLEFAVDKVSDGREHFYISTTTVQALLAKVQLYVGDYENAAINSLAVINNTNGYDLNPNYSDIFSERYGTETLLAAYVGPTGAEEGNQGNQFRKSEMAPSQTFINLADAQDGVVGNGSTDFLTGYDPRFSLGFNPDLPYGNNLGKYPNGVLDGLSSTNVIQILRMGEMYLVYAEAETRRPGGSLANALEKLNTIRNRAGTAVISKTLSDKATLLEDIRQEKVLELFIETAEHWFDLVRYHSLGDIDALSLKPTLTSTSQFILPIPQNALLGNSLLVPNPQ